MDYMIAGLAWEFIEGSVTTKRFMDTVSKDDAKATISGLIPASGWHDLYSLPLLSIPYLFHDLEPTWFQLSVPILCGGAGAVNLRVEKPDDVRIVARIICKDGSEERRCWPELEMVHEGAD